MFSKTIIILITLLCFTSCVSSEDVASVAQGAAATPEASPDGNSSSSGNSSGDIGVNGAQLIKVAGDGQYLSSFGITTTPLRVLAIDALGNPVKNSVVDFTVLQGSGSAVDNRVITDDFGLAQTHITSAATTGSLSIIASSVQGSVVFQLTVSNTDYSNHTIQMTAGNSQSNTINSQLASDLEVEIRDSSGTPAANVPVRFTITSGEGDFSGANTLIISTGSNGRALANWNLGPRVGVQGVRAAIASEPSILVNFSATALASYDLATSSLGKGCSELIADGLQTCLLTLTLNDSFANQDTTATGQAVSFLSSAGTLVGSVSDLGNGQYQQYIRSSKTANVSASITATVEGTSMTTSLNIPFVTGPLSLSESTLSLASQIISPTSTTDITLQLKDAGGNNLNSDLGSVLFSNTAGGTIGAVSYIGGGRYRATLTAPSSTGSDSISATIDGETIGSPINVVYNGSIGSPDAANSTITMADNNLKINESTTVVVRLRDAGGADYPVGGDTIALASTVGNLNIVNDLGNGTYSATFTAPPTLGSGTISATLNGTPLSSTTSFSVYGDIDIATSTVSSSVSTINTPNTLTVTVTAKDAAGTLVESSTDQIVINSNYGSPQGSIVNNGNGTYSQVFSLPQSTGCFQEASFSATANGAALVQTKEVVMLSSGNLYPNHNDELNCSNKATYENQDVCIKDGVTFFITNFSDEVKTCNITLKSLEIASGGILSHLPADSTNTFGMDFSITEDLVNNGEIIADGLGYRGGVGVSSGSSLDYQGYSKNMQRVSGLSSGGSHIGKGGVNWITYQTFQTGSSCPVAYHGYNSDLEFDSASDPVYPGGGGSLDYSGAGDQAGHGGGIIRISAANIINNGKISADGVRATNLARKAGGGAGGAIKLSTAGALTGSGQISANGAAGSGSGGDLNYSCQAGGGGGGAIAIHGDDTAYSPQNYRVNGGISCTDNADTQYYRAKGGSIWRSLGAYASLTLTTDLFVDFHNGNSNLRSNIIGPSTDLTIDNAWVVFTTPQISNAVTVASNSIELNSLSLINSATLSTRHANTTNLHHLDLDIAGNISIDASSEINVKGKGNPGAYFLDWRYNAGGYDSLSFTNGSRFRSWHTLGGDRYAVHAGGSYGGLGRYNSGVAHLGAVYGSSTNVNRAGSGGTNGWYQQNLCGGWRYHYYPGGNGGGLVRLKADQMTINGKIDADGTSGYVHSHLGANGSGGGIYLESSSDISGSGVISANGGGVSVGSDGCAGGGGRIHINNGGVLSGTLTISANMGANLGHCYQAGGNGTIVTN